MAAIPRLAESSQKDAHAGGKVRFGCLKQQVEMIAHQNPGMHPPAVAFADLLQPIKERFVILFPDEKQRFCVISQSTPFWVGPQSGNLFNFSA
jgi:hypothetical protein